MKNQHKELVERLQKHTKWLKSYFNQYKNSPIIRPIIEDLELVIEIFKDENKI